MDSNEATLERIDIRWDVRTRSTYREARGEVAVEASFLMTLGTYSGPTDRKVMADNINARGVHVDDVDSVSCEGGAPSLREAAAALAERGISEADVVHMRIAAVLLDEAEIAQAFDPDRD